MSTATERLPDCGPLIFSHRDALAKLATMWCRSHNAEVCPLNVITALNEMGVIYKKAAKHHIQAQTDTPCGDSEENDLLGEMKQAIESLLFALPAQAVGAKEAAAKARAVLDKL